MVKLKRPPISLLVGDILVLVLVTVAGFMTHNTLGSAGSRILATMLPLLVSWLVIGAHVGVFDAEKARSPGQLWRPFWGMILAAPLFALLRAFMLGVETINTTFIVVMGGIGALAMLAWRALYVFVIARQLERLSKNG